MVTEHMANLTRLWSELSRVIAPGGFLVVVQNHPIFTAPGSAPVIDFDQEVLWRFGDYLLSPSPRSVNLPEIESKSPAIPHRPSAEEREIDFVSDQPAGQNTYYSTPAGPVPFYHSPLGELLTTAAKFNWKLVSLLETSLPFWVEQTSDSPYLDNLPVDHSDGIVSAQTPNTDATEEWGKEITPLGAEQIPRLLGVRWELPG